MTTEQYLLEKYGAILSWADVAKELKTSEDTLYAKRYTGTLGFEVHRMGKRLKVRAMDLARYIDNLICDPA